jgi:trehalose 6-phosphate synthase/phosphatase
MMSRFGPAEVESALRQAFPARDFFVVSNREPYEHQWNDSGTEAVVRRPAGGLTSALDPLMQAVGGAWIAWGSGEADAAVVDEQQRVRVPPEAPAYTLRRVWLNEQDIHQYYFGYSNQFLWPLCHLRPALTRTRRRNWVRYQAVNRRFADVAAAELESSSAAHPGNVGGAVWFQDYHLALAPAMLRAQRPEVTTAHFWHIPFPPIEIFRIATNGRELLEGLVANDLIGFHLPLFCDNFLRCAESLLDGATVDWQRRAVVVDGRPCYVRAFPISIDMDAFARGGTGEGAEAQVERLRARFPPPGGKLGLGVDRVDYSKGLEEKFKALELMWQEHPELRECFSYVQVAVPSRTGIEAYDFLNEKIERMVWAINDRWSTETWRPVHLIKESLPAERLALLYRAADVCVIASLQDGMNLVAKEYVASQPPGSAAALVLSKFAGAVEELSGAIEVNPFDPEMFAEQIRAALLMPEAERRERLGRMHGSIRSIYDWMAEIFDVWGAVARGESAPLSEADQWARLR